MVEGHPSYENDANDYFHEWAYLCTADDAYTLLTLLRKTILRDVDEIYDWEKCKVKITVEVLETPKDK